MQFAKGGYEAACFGDGFGYVGGSVSSGDILFVMVVISVVGFFKVVTVLVVVKFW